MASPPTTSDLRAVLRRRHQSSSTGSTLFPGRGAHPQGSPWSVCVRAPPSGGLSTLLPLATAVLRLGPLFPSWFQAGHKHCVSVNYGRSQPRDEPEAPGTSALPTRGLAESGPRGHAVHEHRVGQRATGDSRSQEAVPLAQVSGEARRRVHARRSLSRPICLRRETTPRQDDEVGLFRLHTYDLQPF